MDGRRTLRPKVGEMYTTLEGRVREGWQLWTIPRSSTIQWSLAGISATLETCQRCGNDDFQRESARVCAEGTKNDSRLKAMCRLRRKWESLGPLLGLLLLLMLLPLLVGASLLLWDGLERFEVWYGRLQGHRRSVRPARVWCGLLHFHICFQILVLFVFVGDLGDSRVRWSCNFWVFCNCRFCFEVFGERLYVECILLLNAAPILPRAF